MKEINIDSKIYENEEFKITNNLREINWTTDLISLWFTNIHWISIEQYKNDVFVLKQNNNIIWYIKWKENLQTIFDEIKQNYEIEIHTQLKLQSLWIYVNNNPQSPIWQKNIEFTKNNLSKYSLEVLIWLYKNSNTDDTLRKDIKANIKERVFDIRTSFTQKKEILKWFENTNIYNELIVLVLWSLKNKAEADNFLHLVGKDKLQEAIKNHLINDDFVEQFYINYDSSDKTRWYSVECDKTIDKDSCNVFSSYVIALWKTSNNPYFNFSIVWNTISKVFDNNLSIFKEQVLPVFNYYKKTKWKLLKNWVSSKILKEYWLIWVIQNILDKTKMSEWQKEIWASLAPLWIAVWAIFELFKYFKKFWFLKWILWLVWWEFALEATTWDSILWLVNKIVYGGFDMSFLTKKNQKKTKEISGWNKEYQKILWFPAFTNMILGDEKLSSLSNYIEYNTDGSVKKFDVKKYVDKLPDSDWRKALLKQMWEKKVSKIFVRWLNQLGVKKNKITDEKINIIYEKYIDWISNKKIDLANTEQQKRKNNDHKKSKTSVPLVSPIWHTDTKPSNTWKENTVGTANNDVEVNHWKEVVVFASKWKSSLPAHTEIQDENVYSFRNLSELEKRVKEELKKKLWEALYKKFNEKLKLLSNLQVFMNYMKIYASINNDEDLWTFGYWSNFYDEMPIFIKWAVFPSYDRLFGSLIKLTKEWKKKELKLLLNKLDDKSILSTLKNIDGQMIKDYDFFFWKHKEDTPLDTEKERSDLLNMLKKWDKFDIEKFFLDKMKTPDFVQSDVISNTQITWLDLNILSDGSLDQAVKEIYSKLDKLSIYWKKVSLNVDKDDLKDILEDLREDTAQMWKEQRMRYIYSMLIWKILNNNEDSVLNFVSWDIKKKLKTYYDTVWFWNSFKQRWQSTIMKWIPIMWAVILTDWIVAWVLPEWAMLGWWWARFIARVATMQNIAWDMSLLLNDQLTGKNALKVAGNLEWYMHTAAYMVVFEIFAVANKTIWQTKTFQKIWWTLEKVGWKTINLKNASIYWLNVWSILTIDTVIFDGEFTAEELMNVLIFGLLAFHGWNFKVFKKNGKINIKEIKDIKKEAIDQKTKLTNRLERIRQTKENELFRLKQKRTNLELELENKIKEIKNRILTEENNINTRKTEMKETLNAPEILKLKQEIVNIENEILKLKQDIDKIDSHLLWVNARIDQRYQQKLNKLLYENYYKDLFLSEIESKVKVKEKSEYDLWNGIKVKINEKWEIILSDNWNISKFKKFKEFQNEYSNIESRIDKSKLTEYITKKQVEYMKKIGEDIEYNIELTDGFYMPKNERIVKLWKKKYSVLKKWDKFYLVEKVKKWWKEIYKIDKAEKIDDFINNHPELVEEFYKNIQFNFEKILLKISWKKIKNVLTKKQLKQIPKFLWNKTVWDILKEGGKTLKWLWKNFKKDWKITPVYWVLNSWVDLIKFTLTWKAEWTLIDSVKNIWWLWILSGLYNFIQSESQVNSLTSNIWSNLLWSFISPPDNISDVLLDYLWFTHSIWTYIWDEIYEVYKSKENNKIIKK